MKRLSLTMPFAVLALCAAGFAALTYAQTKTPAVPTQIIVADAKTTHHLNLYVAQELGLFKKRGLDVKIADVADLAAARDLLVSGQADVFWACPTLAIAAISNGAPLKIISQVKIPCTSVLVVRKDSPIKRYKDLAGKRIGGISPTCEAVIAYTKKAREPGVTFNLEKMAGGAAIAALEAGMIDGVILEEPHVSIAELKGFKVVLRDAASRIPCRTINARNSFLKDNSAALKQFIAAVVEANTIILKNPAARQVVAPLCRTVDFAQWRINMTAS